MEVSIHKGNHFKDHRGVLKFNNDFDASSAKRIYTIRNNSEKIQRGWLGHQIEQRWFISIKGSFSFKIIVIDNWEKPSNNLEITEYILNSENLDVLHVPPGHVMKIQALEEDSELFVLADYGIGEVDDECRFDVDYFFEGK